MLQVCQGLSMLLSLINPLCKPELLWPHFIRCSGVHKHCLSKLAQLMAEHETLLTLPVSQSVDTACKSKCWREHDTHRQNRISSGNAGLVYSYV